MRGISALGSRRRGAATASAEPASTPPDDDRGAPHDSEAVNDHQLQPLREEIPDSEKHRGKWCVTVAVTVLPALALLLACAAAYVKFHGGSVHETQSAQTESVRAATDGTIALLSYKPETVQKELEAAQSRLSGSFLHDYTQLIHDVVIPGAQQKRISAVATVPAAAVVQATGSHAEVLLFVDQTISMGDDAPTNSASSVRVTLDKVDSRWLITQFDPV